MSEPSDNDYTQALKLMRLATGHEPYAPAVGDFAREIAAYREQREKAERERVLSELRATPHERFHVNGQLQERLADIEDSPDRYDATTRSLAAALGRALRNEVSAAKVEGERMLAEVAEANAWREDDDSEDASKRVDRVIDKLRGKESGT